jgi:hypothetical protein
MLILLLNEHIGFEGDRRAIVDTVVANATYATYDSCSDPNYVIHLTSDPNVQIEPC